LVDGDEKGVAVVLQARDKKTSMLMDAIQESIAEIAQVK